MYNQTIIAPATVLMKQAISIIRMSGEDCYKIINTVFSKQISAKGNQIYVGYISDHNDLIDQVVLVCFESPNSFTGEDTIEINCHGGVLVTNKILSLLLKNGARFAEKGEFSQRAFLNGKINLLQAEAINNIVNASNDTSIKLALNNLKNYNSTVIKNYRESLLDIIANIEVNIDYPEYDGIGDLTVEELHAKLKNLQQEIKEIVRLSKIGKIINEGINLLILGKPNVGKSSLLNALLNEEKAIVSEIPGTTRDIVEGKINIGSLTLNVIDTAGIRKTSNFIEQIGILKAKEQIHLADIILFVFENYDEIKKIDKDLVELTKNKQKIYVLNKIDLIDIGQLPKNSDVVYISAIKCDIKDLIERISQLYDTEQLLKDDQMILTNINQISLLERVENSLNSAYNSSTSGFPIDIVNVDLHDAWETLGELLGENYEESLLDTMFSKYCLGK